MRSIPTAGGCFRSLPLQRHSLAMLAAVLLLATHADAVRLRLPEFQAFFNLQNVGWLALSVVMAKGLHELAHALTCRHFGGQCHELGVMLLVFLPCLYCNVSDAWMFDSRWRRAAVDVAGMYVELVLAAACTFLWWFTVPGWINTICFNLMVVSLGQYVAVQRQSTAALRRLLPAERPLGDSQLARAVGRGTAARTGLVLSLSTAA